MPDSILSILISRDSMSRLEAEALIREAREKLHALLHSGDEEAAYNICEDYFGLEPDYILELL